MLVLKEVNINYGDISLQFVFCNRKRDRLIARTKLKINHKIKSYLDSYSDTYCTITIYTL